MTDLIQGEIYDANCHTCKAYSHCQERDGRVIYDGNMMEVYDMKNHFGENHHITKEYVNLHQWMCLVQGGTYVSDTQEIKRLTLNQGLSNMLDDVIEE